MTTIQPNAPPPPVQWDPNTATRFDGEVSDGEFSGDEEPEGDGHAASAPPIENIVPGYENLTSFNVQGDVGLPPAYEMHPQYTPIDPGKEHHLSDDEAREALLGYVGQRCCYGKGAAEKMKINKVDGMPALRYTLETFTESRSSKWQTVPYSGEFVDGPHMGPAPPPWAIVCSFAEVFKDQAVKIEVPHTASVRACHSCYGKGFVRCWKCRGRGTTRCVRCGGDGRRAETRDGNRESVRCSSCGGDGRGRCDPCRGSGCVRCKACAGYGQLKQCVELTVTYRNRKDDHVIEKTDMPDHLIRDVTGDVIYEQVAARVGPIQNYVVPAINEKALEIVNRHATMWPSERIHQQRQKLQSVPVFEVEFKYGDEKGRFWVYGDQRSVFTKDYPHTCLCCAIL